MSDAPGDPTRRRCTFSYQGKTAEFPVVRAVDGRDSVDISTFTKQTGLTALDLRLREHRLDHAARSPTSTATRASCATAATRSKSSRNNSTYLEVAWLLIYGELPTPTELAEFDEKVRRHTLLHEDLKRFFSALPHTAHPMSVLSSAVSALSTYYEDSLDPHNPERSSCSTIRLLAKLPVIAAYAHKKALGQAFLYPDNSLSFVDNFLKLNFGNLAELYEVNPVLVKALDRLLILHEDHEQNASTVDRAPGRLDRAPTCSRRSRPASTPSTARCTAARTRRCSRCSAQIRDSGESVQHFVERVKNKEDGVKLMGFGHRVYKNFDPRAKLVKESADEVLAALGVSDPLLDIAKELEQVALADDYFIERKLYPNVDFYTGVIYKAMGFPTRMFTVLFAIGRLPGWIAHWREVNGDPATKIGRPQQLYVGPPARDWPTQR